MPTRSHNGTPDCVGKLPSKSSAGLSPGPTAARSFPHDETFDHIKYVLAVRAESDPADPLGFRAFDPVHHGHEPSSAAGREGSAPAIGAEHGHNRPATYQHAERLKKLLNLNLKPFLPKITAAHRDAVYGPIPTADDEESLKQFSALMKLEPFQRGMKEIAPAVWITALRRVQNPNRAELDIVSEDKNFGTLKVSPLFYGTDADMEAYLTQHNLPNEWDYFDPAKADEKRECGLHAAWGQKALGSGV